MSFDDTVRAVLDHKGIGVCAVSPETPVYEALTLMASRDIGAVLVVSETQLEGVFSEREYARKVVLHGKSSKGIPVREIMEPPVTASLEENVAECMRRMTSYKVRYLPVLHEGTPIGVVSIGDLVNWVIRRQEEEIHHLHDYIAGSYPA